MISLVLDPFMLACPDVAGNATKSQLYEYVERLISWKELGDIGWATVYIPSDATGILAEENCYPPYDSLAELIREYGIEDVDPYLVQSLVLAFLSNSPVLEDCLSIYDLELSSFSIDPDFVSSRPIAFSACFSRLAVLAALFQERKPVGCKACVIVTPIGDRSNLQFDVRFTIECILLQDGEREAPDQLIESSKLLGCSTYSALSDCIDPVLVLLSSKSADGFMDAIIHYIHSKYRHDERLNDEDIRRSCVFNEHFYDSARRLGFCGGKRKAEKLLRACSETLLKTNLIDTHALRVSQGGGSPQRTRGEDKAWRRDIDYDYHLHYWETNSGVELACVVTHNDMSIPE